MLCLIPLIYLIQKWNSHQKHPKTICFVANSYKRPNKCHGVWKKASPMAGPFAGNAPFLLTSMERHMIMPERCNMCFQVCVRKMKPSSFHFRAQWFHKVYICLHAFDPISTKVHAIGTYIYLLYLYFLHLFGCVRTSGGVTFGVKNQWIVWPKLCYRGWEERNETWLIKHLRRWGYDFMMAMYVSTWRGWWPYIFVFIIICRLVYIYIYMYIPTNSNDCRTKTLSYASKALYKYELVYAMMGCFVRFWWLLGVH